MTWRGPAAARLASYVHWGALAATLCVLLATAWSYAHGALGCVDNGDGLYLYPAYRLAQGAVLYRDVMGTQPPVVYLIGAAAWKAGLSLVGIRLVGAAMRAACAALVYALGRALFRDGLVAALASLCYALLPIGLAWDRWFNSNSPLTLVILLAACGLARGAPRSARLAGALAVLGLFTKDLYFPILVATVIYIARRQRPLLAPYMQGFVVGGVALVAALVAYAGPRGPRDAFFGQAGSPLNGAWFVASGAYVVLVEGGLLAIASTGAYLLVRHRGSHGRAPRGAQSYALYLFIGSSAVLLATLKEGTFGTVFACAEPSVALLTAYAFVRAARAVPAGGRHVLPAVLCVALTLAALTGVIGADRAALAMDDSAAVDRVVALVRARARPGALILAPPYYALRAGARIPGDASDTYILLRQERGGDTMAAHLARDIVRDVGAGRFPVVVEDAHIAAFPGITSALRARYRPIYADALPPAVHAVVWAPARR